MKNKLINSAKDPKTFWSTLKRISSKKRVTGNIDKDVWLEHFSNVFNATTEPYENVFDGSLHECFSETFNLQLNGDISHNEVVEAIMQPSKTAQGGWTRHFNSRDIYTFRGNHNSVPCGTFQSGVLFGSVS